MIAAYNAGWSTVNKWLENQAISRDGKTIPVENLPDISVKNYVQNVMNDYSVYQELYYSEVTTVLPIPDYIWKTEPD